MLNFARLWQRKKKAVRHPETRSKSLRLERLEDRTLLSLMGQSLFPANNAWNQKIDQAPVAANSAAIMSSIIGTYGDGRLHPDFSQDFGSNSPLWGIPYNVVHGNSVPKLHVVIDGYASESDLLDAPIPANAVLEGDMQNGPTVGLNNRGDSHLIVWDEDNNVAYEFYGASRPSENSDGLWHAGGEAVWDMKTNSFRTLGYTSADAAGLAILPGLARPDEGLPTSEGGQGAINHAIRVTLQNPVILDQFIYPASHVADPGNTNAAVQPPMGARLRLKASVDISTLNPESRVMAQAMKDYGLIVADNGGNFFFSGASDSVDGNNKDVLTWNDNDIQDTVHGMKSLVYSDFEVVDLTPIVTGLSSTTGSAGTQVTVLGKNFSGAAGRLQVLFGNTPATSVTVVDDSHVLAVVPAGSGTVDVRVQSGVSDPNDPSNINSPIFGYGTSAASTADRFTYGTSTSNAATHLGVSAASSTLAGAALNVTVTALDANNLTAAGYLGTVHFSSSDAQASLPADYTFTAADNGKHTFAIALKTAGSQSITAADRNSAGIAGSASGIIVNPAAAARLSVAAPASATSGTAFSTTVTAFDAYGNRATGYLGTVRFTSSDAAATLPAAYTFAAADNGTHTFSGVTLRTAGTQSLTVADTGNASIGGSASVAVTLVTNPATHLGVSASSSTTAGATLNVTITALDANNTPVAGYVGTVHFSSSDTQASLPADYTFTAADNGVHTFTIALKTAGSQSITAADVNSAGIAAGVSGILVNPAAAARLSVAAPASATSGTPFSVTVTAFDAYGNQATGYAATIGFSSSDAAATLPAAYTFDASDSGVCTFSGVTLTTAGTQSLAVADTGNASINGSDSIAVTSAVTLQAPYNLTASALSRSRILLTWAEDSTDQTGFVIERSRDGSTWTAIATVGANVTSYTSSGLSRRTRYYYRVRAVSTATSPPTYSPYSNVASAVTLQH